MSKVKKTGEGVYQPKSPFKKIYDTFAETKEASVNKSINCTSENYALEKDQLENGLKDLTIVLANCVITLTKIQDIVQKKVVPHINAKNMNDLAYVMQFINSQISNYNLKEYGDLFNGIILNKNIHRFPFKRAKMILVSDNTHQFAQWLVNENHHLYHRPWGKDE